MPLGTLDRTPPPFFRQGLSALSKLIVCSALAVFLMVADARLDIAHPLRIAVAGLLYPAQWLVLQPIGWSRAAIGYLQGLQTSQSAETRARAQLGMQSQRANQVEQLLLENARLRGLLALRERVTTSAQVAQVLYDAADPFSRKVVVDKGLIAGIATGSPVIDEQGVLGQVTRVYPALSEVTLVTDRDHATPVLNIRTGARGVAYGDSASYTGGLELRFMGANSDVQVGDLLATSGVDGVYPPGLPVARVQRVDRRVDSAFARVVLQPVGLVDGTAHVMILQPVSEQIPDRPSAEPAPASGKRSNKK